MPVEQSDGRYYRRGAGAEHFFKFAAAPRFVNFVDRNAAFLDFVSFGFKINYNRIARYAGKDVALEFGGNDRVADHKEHVHRADFVDIFMLDTVKPEHLSVAFLFGVVLPDKRSGVVAADFCKPGPAFYGADVFVLDADLDGSESAGVIRSAR